MRKKGNPSRKDTEDQTKMLSKIMELSTDAIVTTSLDGIITSWNRGAELIYGYSAKEALGMPISTLDPPILVGETEELNELIKFEDQINNYETLRLRKDGKIINVSLTLSPFYDGNEHPVAILVISNNITERKQAEENLRINEEINKVILEHTEQVMYTYDLRTDKCKWSGAIEELTGYSYEEFHTLGKWVWVTLIQPSTNRTDTKSQTIRKNEDSFKEEFKLRKKDGTYIDIEDKGFYFKDNEGRPYKAIGVIKDITDWKLATKKIEESERKYLSFIQNFRGIVYQADENFVPIFLHGAVEEVTGYRVKDFANRIKWKDIIHPDDLSLVLNEEEKIQSSKYDIYGEIEFRIKHKDGSVRWVNEIYQKTKRKGEKPGFYQSTIYDFTEKKEAEKLLAILENTRKQEIHHRIKNNLQVISSLLDLQAETFRNKECIKDSEVIEAFKESQDRVFSMALIHEELHKGGEIDTLNFSQYIKELADNLFLTYRLGNTGTSMEMDVEEDIFFDMDIAVPLGIIVNELVSNSLKYAFRGRDKGEIRIKLSGGGKIRKYMDIMGKIKAKVARVPISF